LSLKLQRSTTKKRLLGPTKPGHLLRDFSANVTNASAFHWRMCHPRVGRSAHWRRRRHSSMPLSMDDVRPRVVPACCQRARLAPFEQTVGDRRLSAHTASVIIVFSDVSRLVLLGMLCGKSRSRVVECLSFGNNLDSLAIKHGNKIDARPRSMRGDKNLRRRTSYWLTAYTRRPASANRTASRQFQAQFRGDVGL